MFPTTLLYIIDYDIISPLCFCIMIVFPCAKINLGLNIVARRTDGYHDLETVFYPIPLCDRLEITVNDDESAAQSDCFLTIDGREIDCANDDNLVVRAYRLLVKDYPLPPVKALLHKTIPTQAGLGGGSSDAAYTLRALNSLCALNISDDTLASYAARLGADCPFFITSQPAFASGIGDRLSPLKEGQLLRGYILVVVKPDVSVSTKEAYAMITPRRPAMCCMDVLAMPITEWRHHLRNDFEPSVFAKHPILAEIKHELYSLGALYVQMSGSGSSIFALFHNVPNDLRNTFPDCITYSMEL